MTHDYVHHALPGPMDMNWRGFGTPFILAAADGEVTCVEDARNGCGCTDLFFLCQNYLNIRHGHGEISTYYHIAQYSATNHGIHVGDRVLAGQIIGIEGDVGFTCGSGSDPRFDPCIGQPIPPGTRGCNQHLHWSVRREVARESGIEYEYVNPYTCGINRNIYEDGTVYFYHECNVANCPPFNSLVGTFSGFGTFKIVQAFDTITASAAT